MQRQRLFWWLFALATWLVACSAPRTVPRQGTTAPRPRPLPGTANATPVQPGAAQPARTPTQTTATEPAVLLIGIGVHIEPFGTSAQGFTGNLRGDYEDPAFFERQVNDLRALADLVAHHGGRLTVQVQSPFTTVALARHETILADLVAQGHEIGLHFHEEVHVGPRPEQQSVAAWCQALQEEKTLAEQAAGGEARLRYWSGGNLYPELYDAAVCAGLRIHGDWKNPRTQEIPLGLAGLHPWRPAGGTDGRDFTALITHDPQGRVIFLPEGLADPEGPVSRREVDAEVYFQSLARRFQASLEAAEAGQVNLFRFTVHPGEFRGDPNEPFGLLERFLQEVVDPAVAAGRARWATYGQMADAYEAWENEQAEQDSHQQVVLPSPSATNAGPSSTMTSTKTSQGYFTFVINVHDWVHHDESAATVLRLVNLFARYGVRGDFYFTAPVARTYAEYHPEVLNRLREESMTISYHVRAPHPLTQGFGDRLENLDEATLAETLRAYATHRLDLRTGDWLPGETGGYAYVTQCFGQPPVTVALSASPRIREVALQVYADLGAQAVVLYHEEGADLAHPLVFTPSGLLIRPADFSVLRLPDGNFWWNGVARGATGAHPVTLLTNGLDAWWAQQPPRAPYILAQIHENNFYRRGSVAWGSFYYTIDARGNKVAPLSPPFDLLAPDPSTPRSAAEQAAIWQAYEDLVAYVATHFQVVTSADLVAQARP